MKEETEKCFFFVFRGRDGRGGQRNRFKTLTIIDNDTEDVVDGEGEGERNGERERDGYSRNQCYVQE